MNLNDLRAFVQAVDHGGFSAASRALNIPKQTLSNRVAELERQAGVRLIQRTSRNFTVTELGQELYRHAAAMVVEAQAASDVIAGRLAEPSGTVRITASVPAVQLRLGPLMPRIARAYPKITIVLHANDRFVDIVQERYDLALRSHWTPLTDSDLVQRRLSEDPFWLIASPALLGGRKPSEPSELSGLPIVGTQESDDVWTLHNDHGAQYAMPVQAAYVANESAAILAAAQAGLGIASLPSFMCADQVRSGTLVRVCPDWTAGKVTTTMLMPSRRGLLPSVRVVSDMIAEQLGRQS